MEFYFILLVLFMLATFDNRRKRCLMKLERNGILGSNRMRELCLVCLSHMFLFCYFTVVATMQDNLVEKF